MRGRKRVSISILVPRGKADPARTLEIKKWIEEVFQISDDQTVMVTELQCSEHGCPPVETVIVIMGAAHYRVQHKLHKAVGEVTVEDIRALRTDPARAAADVMNKHS
jgi:hypothetical protein